MPCALGPSKLAPSTLIAGAGCDRPLTLTAAARQFVPLTTIVVEALVLAAIREQQVTHLQLRSAEAPITAPILLEEHTPLVCLGPVGIITTDATRCGCIGLDHSSVVLGFCYKRYVGLMGLQKRTVQI